MSNTSATGGPLAPETTPAPLEGQDLNRFLQQVVAGISGLDGTVIFPRWQKEPPNLPSVGVNWAAVGIVRRDPDTYAAILHDPDGGGGDELQRHETIEMLASFYGPQADSYLEIFRDGLQIAQNREVLQLAGMGLVDTGEAIAVPSLVKDQWLYRVDITMTIRRQIRRVYPVLNILSSGGTITTDNGLVNQFQVTQ